MKIIHISDLHYGSIKNVNSDANHHPVSKLVDAMLKAYEKQEKKPLIVLTGDILASSFKKKKSERAKKELKRLSDSNFKLLICPGNHDLKKSGLSPTFKGRKKFNSVFKSLVDSDSNVDGSAKNSFYNFPLVHKFEHYYFIGLDSLESQNMAGATGELGGNQLTKLSKKMKEIKKDKKAVITVYLHHKPFGRGNKELKDRRVFKEMIKGEINVLLFGHIHKNERQIDKEKKYAMNCIVNSGNSTAYGIHWSEIDLTDYSLKNYPKDF